MKKLIALMIIILIAVLAPVVARAAPLESADHQATPPPTLCEFLAEMGTVAMINLIVGIAMSGAVEYWPWWETAPVKWKRPIILGLCFVVPVLGLGLSYVLCGGVVTQDTIYTAIMAGLAAFMSSQLAHIRKLPSG